MLQTKPERELSVKTWLSTCFLSLIFAISLVTTKGCSPQSKKCTSACCIACEKSCKDACYGGGDAGSGCPDCDPSDTKCQISCPNNSEPTQQTLQCIASCTRSTGICEEKCKNNEAQERIDEILDGL